MKDIIIFTKFGKIIRFDSSQTVRQIRGGIGIKAITLKPKDAVVAAYIIDSRK